MNESSLLRRRQIERLFLPINNSLCASMGIGVYAYGTGILMHGYGDASDEEK